MKEWISDVIGDPKRRAIPIMTHPGIEYIGKSVREAVTNGNIHFDAIRTLDKMYPSAACTVIMDLTVEAEAFGAEVIFPEDEIPTVTGRLLCDNESIGRLTVPDMSAGRIRQYLLANKLAAGNITDKPVFGGCIGPFSLAGRLFDLSEIMMACYCEPDTAKALLSKCKDFLKNYCGEIKKQGADGVIIAEPAAGLLSPEGCGEFSSAYIKEIVDAVQDDYFAVILHNCGNKGHCTNAMVATGAYGYHFGNQIDMVTALEQCPKDVLVMGNLDPSGLFKNSSSEELYKATKELLEKTAHYPNFVLSSGCDIPPHIPVENIHAFYNALKEFNLKG
jgi:Uroporphyrinogen-III decarboxylase